MPSVAFKTTENQAEEGLRKIWPEKVYRGVEPGIALAELVKKQGMLPVCLPSLSSLASLSCSTLAPLALAWALFAYNFLPEILADREK
jgi:hypothetical protein